MKFSKLTIKCICVMLPIIAICLWAKFAMPLYADQEAPYYTWNKEICASRQDKNYNVVILGDSGCNGAYAPEILSDDTINLSLGGTTPVENYYVLEEYLRHNDAPKILYISFSDAHLNAEDCFYNRIMFTHRFNPAQLFDIIKNARKYNEASIITENYLSDFISYEFYLPNKYITSILTGKFYKRAGDNKYSKTMIDFHRGRYMSVAISENPITDPVPFDEFTVAPLFDEYYKKMLSLCNNYGIAVRLVKIPMDENAQFSDNYEASLYNYYDNLTAEYQNSSFEWVKGGYGHFYFADIVHSNNRGARMFSEIIKYNHPDDFPGYYTDSQYKIIDHDIQIETDFNELFHWIRGKEYSVFVYDVAGDFVNAFNNDVMPVTGIEIYKTDIDDVYVINGLNSENKIYELTRANNSINIINQAGDNTDWDITTGSDNANPLKIIIMNDHFGTVVRRL